MKETNKLFLRMAILISKYLKNTDALASMQVIKELIAKLDALIEKAEILSTFIDTESKTVTVAVDAANCKVVAPLYAVMKALEHYYIKQNDTVMVADLHTTRTEIKRLSYDTIEASAKKVQKLAKDNLTHLAVYNITEAQLTAIDAGMAELTTANTALVAYQEEKKAKRVELNTLMNKGKELLDEVDMVVEIVSLTHPEAQKGYAELRSKREYNENILTIAVLNSETGKPEENARVLVQSTTKTEKGKPVVLLDRKTGKSGEVRNSKRIFDLYRLTAEKLGFHAEDKQIVLADNTPIRIEILLKRIEGTN
ncbi:hypothetical protein [uncultured Acetobacteroides sp.]|uniref:hypothetical protein n=1 Tax=uncultured Acetobacteroides sp. TaxID=1760811 RepID=UPI0029F4EFCE|nr:hypothetical protein [uncultured Acetobacteroides sp.]